jgi:hypothetical protein
MTARTKPKVDLDATIERLQSVGLPHAADHLRDRLEEASKDNSPAHLVIDRLLGDEIAEREQRRVRTALKLSALPTGQTLGSFDFAFQPAVERSQIETLATCAWLRGRETLLIQGRRASAKPTLRSPSGSRRWRTASRSCSCASRSSWRRSSATPTCLRRNSAPAQVPQRGALDHRRDGLRAHGPPVRQLVLPPGQLPLRTGLDPDHHQQGDQGLTRAASRRRGTCHREPGSTASP